MTEYNISFAGAGNVAGALCREMFRSGIRILQVVSETEKDGKPLADECNAEWSRELIFSSENHAVIVAVPDHRLKEVLASVSCSDQCVVAHTAGSFGLDIFPAHLRSTGVFYPLQTFTRGRETQISNIPFLLEASDDYTGRLLQGLVSVLGASAAFMGSERRRMLHLAAVFVCNFTNFMLVSGKDITSEAGISFSILEPLIRETVNKALDAGPEKSQTGPAVRNDLITIEKHLKLLSFSPELQAIYSELTDRITEYYKKN